MNSQRILGDIDLFLMLSRLLVNPHPSPSRAMLSTRRNQNKATAELLKATVQHRDFLLSHIDDYDQFCKKLAKLGGFSIPYTIEGTSADWFVPYLLLVNGMGELTYLFMVLSSLPPKTKIELPITQEKLDNLRSGMSNND